MKKIAVFIAPNPMHPNTRLMGIETTKMVANAAEAVALAEKNNWEFCGFRT